MNYFSSDFKLGILGMGQLGKMLFCLTPGNFDIQTLCFGSQAMKGALKTYQHFYRTNLRRA
jgi:phosphoribosylaminoimidazole carboxylase (NCAIR synthetase)